MQLRPCPPPVARIRPTLCLGSRKSNSTRIPIYWVDRLLRREVCRMAHPRVRRGRVRRHTPTVIRLFVPTTMLRKGLEHTIGPPLVLCVLPAKHSFSVWAMLVSNQRPLPCESEAYSSATVRHNSVSAFLSPITRYSRRGRPRWFAPVVVKLSSEADRARRVHR